MKTKKKLLLMGVGAMSALAIGVGATSTFAWFGVQASAKVATSADAYETMTVSENKFKAGSITVPVIAALQKVAADESKLVLARHSSTDTTDPDLESAYLNTAGTVVPVSAANLDEAFGGSGLKLYSSLTLTITVKWADTGWKKSDGSTQATSYSDAATYTYGGVTYSRDSVMTMLNAQNITVMMKNDDTLDRGRLFRTTSGSGDPFYYNGTSAVEAIDNSEDDDNTNDDFNGYTVIDASLGDDFTEGVITKAAYVNYYVHGSHVVSSAEATDSSDGVQAKFHVIVTGA